MSQQTLIIEVEFPKVLSRRDEQDVQRAIGELIEAIDWLGGKVVKAELRKPSPSLSPEQGTP